MRYFILIIVILLTGGCYGLKDLQVPVIGANKTLSDKSVSVCNFEEMRDHYYYDKTLLGALPPIPYGFKEVDSVRELDGLYSKDLVKGLKYSKIFKNVFYDPLLTVKSDYAVEGEILSTKLRAYRMSYGISGIAFFLWLARAPQTIYVDEIIINVRFINNQTGKLIFEKKYIEIVKYYQFIFTQFDIKRKNINASLSRIISNNIITDISEYSKLKEK